jgi:hypothetical protein
MSEQRFTLDCPQVLAHCIAYIARLDVDAGWEVTIKRAGPKQRTLTQNRALHKFCELLAETLNDAGLDMRQVLKPEIDIPWNRQSVKDHLWRPIQKAMTGEESTADLNTVEPSEIHAVLARHLGAKLGVVCPPWPSREPS